MFKTIHWIFIVLLLGSSAETPLPQTDPQVMHIYPLDHDYPTLPLPPLSPKF
jgi:hypothetical protein